MMTSSLPAMMALTLALPNDFNDEDSSPKQQEGERQPQMRGGGLTQ